MQVQVDGGFMPQRGSESSAGLDLYATENYDLKPGLHLLPIGIKIKFPKNYYGQIFCRSSLAIKGCSVEGGVIDEDYRGEIKVLLRTRNKITIEKKDKIAQLVVLPYWTGTPVQTSTKLNETRRGEGSFGSTGK